MRRLGMAKVLFSFEKLWGEREKESREGFSIHKIDRRLLTFRPEASHKIPTQNRLEALHFNTLKNWPKCEKFKKSLKFCWILKNYEERGFSIHKIDRRLHTFRPEASHFNTIIFLKNHQNFAEFWKIHKIDRRLHTFRPEASHF